MSAMTDTEQPRRNARYHTTKTAAERAEVSEVTVKKWCQDPDKRQRLGAWKPGKKWKIPFEHFEKLIAHAQATGGNIF
jgi:excisionase family DNA binding protein